MKRTFPLLLTAALAGMLASSATAQMNVFPTSSVPEPKIDELKAKGLGVVHFVSNLGSFRTINGEGRLEFEFKGTVLVSKLQGTITPTGSIRTEYQKDGRQLFSGAGRLVVEGKWRAVQWFGSNMRGVWWGKGALRLVGEFDKNLQTGDYWFDRIEERASWPANGTITLFLPKPNYGGDGDVVPKEKKKGG